MGKRRVERVIKKYNKTIVIHGKKYVCPIEVREIMKPVFILTLECSKCHHVWVPKSKGIFLSKKTMLEQQEDLIKNAPKKCPECNSPDWHTPNKPGGHKWGDKEFKKRLGSKRYRELEHDIDKTIKSKDLNDFLNQLNVDIPYYQDILDSAKKYKAETERKLKELEKK